MKTDLLNLKTLFVMQLKDKLDMSFAKSARATLFKVAGKIGQFLLSGVAFFLIFYVASLLKLFSFTGVVPASVMTALLTFIFALSLISCTAGLTDALYQSADNRILLTLPVKPNTVFLSKLALYFYFELRKNLLLLLPMYTAYGIVMSAAWYFYPWLVVCFVMVSLLPVAIAAVLSIPTLFVVNFIKKYKWLQLILMVAVTALVGWGLIALIGIMPENINIAGQWSTIANNVQKVLAEFAGYVMPLDKINLMIIGGATEIRSKLFTENTLWGLLFTVGTTIVCIGLAYLLARPLFFKMASQQFEFEKDAHSQGKNKIHSRYTTSFLYETIRAFRSSRFVINQMCGLLVLPIAVYLLNKTYSAMNTRLSGQYMTVGFTLLVALLIVTSENVSYASVLSADGNARPIAKTQPIIPQISITARLIVRLIVMIVSTTTAMSLWQKVTHLGTANVVLAGLAIVFAGTAHLFWSVEMDVMNPQHDQFATVGTAYNNPNERNSTIYGFVMSFLLAFFAYFIMGEGQTKAFVKIMLIALAFMLFRAYLYFARIRLYYAEK